MRLGALASNGFSTMDVGVLHFMCLYYICGVPHSSTMNIATRKFYIVIYARPYEPSEETIFTLFAVSGAHTAAQPL